MNNNQSSASQNHKILWLQVWGLAIVQTAFSLSWLVYRLYLPQLLAGFGLKGLDKLILIVEDGLNTIVEPLAGTFSDRTKKFTGTRLPMITIGIILSSVFFIAIPAFFILGKSITLQWVFVGILILWAIAMAIFRAPVMSLLGQYSQPKELPEAATLIVFAGLFINAIRPISTKFILGLGEGFAFFIGSLVLLGAIVFLRKIDPHLQTNPPTTPDTNTDNQLPQKLSIQNLILLFIIGIGVGLGMRLLMMGLIPPTFKTQLTGFNQEQLMSTIAAILALMVFPAGRLAKKFGNEKIMILAAIATAILSLIFGITKGIMILPLAIIIMAGLSLILNGAFPLSLSLVPTENAGLGVGIYFGGFAVAGTIYQIFFIKPPETIIGSILTAIALIIAALCIKISAKVQTKSLPI